MTFGDARDTIYKTDYRDGAGTGKLTNYMGHDQQAVRDRAGREMTDEEIEQFNEKAAGKRNRHLILSPSNKAELSDRELDRATRQYMNDLTEDRPTADYVYSIHDDKERRDIHVAMTADDRSDLEMYPDDIKRERQSAHETYREHQRGREQSQEQEQTQQPESELEREQKRRERQRKRRERAAQDNEQGISR